MISGTASGDADFSGKHGFRQQVGDRTESLALHYAGNAFTTQAAQTGIIPKIHSNWNSELRFRVPAYQPCEVHGLRIILLQFFCRVEETVLHWRRMQHSCLEERAWPGHHSPVFPLPMRGTWNIHVSVVQQSLQ